MEKNLKELFIQIAERLTPESTLEDVYEQLSLLADIEISEQQEQNDQGTPTCRLGTAIQKTSPP